MEFLQLDEDICRICLEHNVLLNWNERMFEDSDMSYKDCYYKYTDLQENITDPFPTNLCQMCVDDLKNAHLLFNKAAESHKILQIAFSNKDFANEEQYVEITIDKLGIKSMQYFDYDKELVSDDSTDDITLKKIEEEVGLSNMYNEIQEIKENKAVTSEHFLDIQNFETSNENLLKQKLHKNEDRRLLKKVIKKNKKNYSAKEVKKIDTQNREESEIYDKECLKSLLVKSTEREKKIAITSNTQKCGKQQQNREAFTDILIDHELGHNCNVKSSIPASTNNSGKQRKKYERSEVKSPIPDTINKTDKVKKKYILICAYCSFKVNGTNQLKKHEATHSEDRKRTETCPHCGIKLYTKVALNNHMKIHDENRQKDYKCEFCEKAFFHRGALNVHRRIHLGLMVTCPICSKEFCRQIDLNRHLPKHSATPPQKNGQKLKYTVQCQYCNEYVRTDKWREHKAAHLDQPQAKCKICDKDFFARSKCVSHLQRLHKKKKDYEDFIHYYVNCKTRMSHLIIKQQEIVKPVEPPE